MMRIVVGLIVVVATGFLFWRLLPRDGKPHSICGTWLEPYAVVGMLCAVSVGLGIIASSLNAN